MFGTRAVTDVQRLAFAAEEFRAVEGHWPTLENLRALDPALPKQDPWHNVFRFEASLDGFQVRSAGVDGRIDTADDVLSDRIHDETATR